MPRKISQTASLNYNRALYNACEKAMDQAFALVKQIIHIREVAMSSPDQYDETSYRHVINAADDAITLIRNFDPRPKSDKYRGTSAEGINP